MARSTDFYDGLREGVTLFAWWKDGVQQVGTCGRTLKEAFAKIEEEAKYAKPVNLDRLIEQMADHLLRIKRANGSEIEGVLNRAIEWIAEINLHGMSEDQAS